MNTYTCRLKSQGFSAGSCAAEADGKSVPACRTTLKYENDRIYRLITSIHLSRPENYLSIYQSGCSNARILKLPQEVHRRDFVLGVLSLYIPGVVEADDLEKIARLLYETDSDIPFTLLAFFPEYRMKNYRSPTVREMTAAYHKVKATGLNNIRLGNLGVFIRSKADKIYLVENVDPGAF